MQKIRQTELDHILGLPETSINKIEKGTRDLKLHEFAAIAQALGVSEAELRGLPRDQDQISDEEKFIVKVLREIDQAQYSAVLSELAIGLGEKIARSEKSTSDKYLEMLSRIYALKQSSRDK